MDTGLLWCDGSNGKPLEEKVHEAVTAYCAKTCFAGKKPNTCYVHPSLLSGKQEIHLDGIRVVANPVIAPYHLFVGQEDSGDGSERSQKGRRRRKRPSRGRRKGR